MSSPVHLRFYGNSEDKEDRGCLYALSVKTQYAGIETHKLIIHLLKHLSVKYLRDFNVSDEGQYWETGDEKLLQEIFKRYTYLIDHFSFSVQNHPVKQGETYHAYFERILKQIHEKYKKQ